MPRSKATVSKFQVRAIPSRLVSEEKATDDISIPVPVPLYLRLLQLLALAALLTVIAAPSLLPRFSVVDNDLWGHLKVGDWIVEHRSFPHTGILSDTARDRPWMAYSWIDEVVLSFFHSRFSLVGISIYGLLLTLAVAYSILWMTRLLSGSFWKGCALATATCIAFLFNVFPRPV